MQSPEHKCILRLCPGFTRLRRTFIAQAFRDPAAFFHRGVRGLCASHLPRRTRSSVHTRRSTFPRVHMPVGYHPTQLSRRLRGGNGASRRLNVRGGGTHMCGTPPSGSHRAPPESRGLHPRAASAPRWLVVPRPPALARPYADSAASHPGLLLLSDSPVGRNRSEPSISRVRALFLPTADRHAVTVRHGRR